MRYNLDKNNIRELYKLKSFDLLERHQKEIERIYADANDRGMLNSGPAFEAVAEKLKDQIRELAEAYIESIFESIGNKEIDNRMADNINAEIFSFISTDLYRKSTSLKSRLISSGFEGVVSESILNGFESKVKRIMDLSKTKVKLMIEKHNNKIHDQVKSDNYKESNYKIQDINEIWKDIYKEYGIKKPIFAKRIGFIKDSKIRELIYRDVAHAFTLSKNGLAKPAVVLAGSVIEELLRQYLISRNLTPKRNDFNGFIECCKEHKLLRDGISNLGDSVRQFRNYVHLAKEVNEKYKLDFAESNTAVSSIFVLVKNIKS